MRLLAGRCACDGIGGVIAPIQRVDQSGAEFGQVGRHGLTNRGTGGQHGQQSARHGQGHGGGHWNAALWNHLNGERTGLAVGVRQLCRDIAGR